MHAFELPCADQLVGDNSRGDVTAQAVLTARGSVVGEAILPLRIDWWKDRFAVNLQSSPQGLPDLLCVCNEITRLPVGPLGSQPE